MTYQPPPYEPGKPYGEPPTQAYGAQPAQPYGQSAPPPYGQPAYGGYGQQPGQFGGPPPQQQTTSGFAVAALIFGIIGGILLSVIFGIIALGKTKPGGQKGRGMAIAGLVLSALWAVIFAIVTVLVVNAEPTIRATEVEVGDCINAPPEDMARVTSLPEVECSQPHEGEVYAIVKVTDSDFPGQSVLETEYRNQCLPELESYAPAATTDPDISISILYPTQETWDQGDRDVVCIATTEDKRTGSIKG